MGRWAAVFPRSSLHAALCLRLSADLKSLEVSDQIWISAADGYDQIEPRLLKIPDIVRYTVATDDTITRIGRRVSNGTLPQGEWASFSSTMQVHPQPAALPAILPRPQAIQIVRSTSHTAPGALMVPLQAWADYVTTAPMVRLSPLRFSVCRDGRTLILGNPLPPLRGNYFTDHSGLLLPGGYAWSPRVEPEILRRAMNLAAGNLALFDINGSYEMIPAESLVAASRSAARFSLQLFDETAGVR